MSLRGGHCGGGRLSASWMCDVVPVYIHARSRSIRRASWEVFRNHLLIATVKLEKKLSYCRICKLNLREVRLAKRIKKKSNTCWFFCVVNWCWSRFEIAQNPFDLKDLSFLFQFIRNKEQVQAERNVLKLNTILEKLICWKQARFFISMRRTKITLMRTGKSLMVSIWCELGFKLWLTFLLLFLFFLYFLLNAYETPSVWCCAEMHG